MKEIRYSATVQEQQTLSESKAIGPGIDQLKEKFKEGSIPLQTDFNTLIDIANLGRKATGMAPGQSGPAPGMKLSENGLLQLKLNEKYDKKDFSPLMLNNDVLVVGLGSGLVNKSNGICVGEGNGIKVNNDNIAVKLVTNKGMVVDANGIAIKPGNGMQFSSDGALAAKSANKTISVDNSGIRVAIGEGVKVGGNGLDVNTRADGGIGNGSSGIYVKAGNGIKVDANGICVGEGNGIKVNNDNVAVKLATNKGIVVDTNGIAIKSGNGMQFSSDGALAVKSANKTISVDNSGIRVAIGEGVKVGGNGLDVNTRADGGIGNGSSGIYVKAGNGIKVDANGVTIDPNKVLPKGMIVMFSGSAVPVGWAFCDGKDGTPDLRDKFILGAKNISEKAYSSKTISGSGKNRAYNVTTNTSQVSVTIEQTALTEAQMPEHKHNDGMAYHVDAGSLYSAKKMINSAPKYYTTLNNHSQNTPVMENLKDEYYTLYTSNSGSGKGHTHKATSTAHSHSVDVLPPYYTLAFIIKL
ncbi:tail fiber protein [Xenorhabdus bovienii]|uniref:tail fiber protein n=1 Tax=Xenorhabdus bovienii TaxID=40576 RepID=UPI00237CE4AF|nr:tail fiber protein [Xenorhabdus bovienii]MDE1474200.1 phage tail protein [Xenorhabdus bovienii]MDE9453168.1 phage tail protein [Xenorhabdus bovienii]MDE9562817.1 phage tail protein [Xenorhabdus bovienii]